MRDLSCNNVNVTETGGGEWQAAGCGLQANYTCVHGDTSETDEPNGLVCAREGDLDSMRPAVVEAPASTASAPPTAPHSPSAMRAHFPLTAAIATMKLAASYAEDCNTIDGPRGAGTVDVVFGGDGHVTSVTLSAPFQGTPVGECVANKFRRVVLPAFQNGPKKTSKAFEIHALPTASTKSGS